jgi:hypothetical protein
MAFPVPSRLGSFILVSGLVFCARAQEFRATIQGIVTDSSQAVVVGATVTLHNVKTNVGVVKQTNDAGLYRFDYVDPGSYTISVQSSGFAKFVQQNIVAQARGGAIQNFFKIENVLGEFRGFKEKMAAGKEPVVRKSVMQFPEGPGLGLEINEDWLRQHMAKGETWWG